MLCLAPIHRYGHIQLKQPAEQRLHTSSFCWSRNQRQVKHKNPPEQQLHPFNLLFSVLITSVRFKPASEVSPNTTRSSSDRSRDRNLEQEEKHCVDPHPGIRASLKKILVLLSYRKPKKVSKHSFLHQAQG